MDGSLEEVQQLGERNQINLNLLAQQLGDIRADLREVRNQVSAMNRPDRATLISLGLFIILCGGGLWGLAIKPINDQLNQFATSKEMELKLGGIQKDIILLNEHLKEQDSKYVTKDQLNQLNYEVNKRLVR